MGWIWLDGVEVFEKATRVKAWKKWEASFPVAYLVEMIAQAGAILLGAESRFEDDVVFTKIEGAQFFGRPQAGRRLEIEVQAENLRVEGGRFLGRIFQEGEKILEGRVLLMNIGRLRPDGKGPVTFPEPLIEALK
jgi:hypothetical protein